MRFFSLMVIDENGRLRGVEVVAENYFMALCQARYLCWSEYIKSRHKLVKGGMLEVVRFFAKYKSLDGIHYHKLKGKLQRRAWKFICQNLETGAFTDGNVGMMFMQRLLNKCGEIHITFNPKPWTKQ